ncbi:MAG: nucleotide exchange factor GrpE [Acidobacteriia bacterium]|nr:nucleotide exchange factor GrpE [Terriglobia bacterium]
MRKGNGKTDVNLDLEHELPPAEGGEESASTSSLAKPAEVGVAGETEKLKAERDALLDRLARLQAEFDNARKRAVREQQEFREFAAADVIKTFLPTLDSFEHALKAGGDSSEFRNGVELIYRQFQDALQKIGVQPIVALGQPFDPRVHEAIEMVDTTEVPDHHVMDELQRGYKFKERLLRPAMVRVARNSHG